MVIDLVLIDCIARVTHIRTIRDPFQFPLVSTICFGNRYHYRDHKEPTVTRMVPTDH